MASYLRGRTSRSSVSIPGSIFLVGMMGAGKTSVGRVLAKRLGKTFCDSDHVIEERTGVRIPLIFDIEGEEGFRSRERAVIRELAERDNIVLATGGGAVLDAENRRVLHERGTVVYLRAAVRELINRTRHDKNRPLLQTGDPQARITAIFEQRDPLYKDIAHVVIETGSPSLHSLVNRLEAQLITYQTQAANSTHKMPSRTLDVSLGSRSYPIVIGTGVLDDSKLIVPHLTSHRVVIVTNETVAPLFLEPLETSLREASIDVLTIKLPDGEQHKTWNTLNSIFDAMLAARCDRTTTIIALGGGVVGDVAGFAAATYQRGIPYIQIPTTLLAQVDSSVGGKTAINHPLGKNMIGAFYQPRLVLADISTLTTLPARELSAGLAEVIKYGAIMDAEFFAWLEQNMDRLVAREPDALGRAVEVSCRCKSEIVAADEREAGRRALLNFGHTFGHAIEAGLGFGTWLHGEAVSAGMLLAAKLSARQGDISDQDVARLQTILDRAGLPTKAPNLGAERYLELMGYDKKVHKGQLRLVLLRSIGDAFLTAEFSSVELTKLLQDIPASD